MTDERTMTPAQHYVEAERLLRSADLSKEAYFNEDARQAASAALVARAHVHALLALATGTHTTVVQAVPASSASWRERWREGRGWSMD